LSFSTISAFIGLYIAIKNKPQFQSSLSFVIEGSDTGGKGFAGIASALLGAQASSNPSMFNSANIMSLLLSRSLIQSTLLKPINKNSSKSFADYYIEFNDLEEHLKKDENSKTPKFRPIIDSENLSVEQLSIEQNRVLNLIYLQIIEKNLVVENKDPDNSIIYIDVNSSNEFFSVQFPKELIKVVSTFYIETKIRKAKLNYQMIKMQTDSVRNELNNAISGVASANDNTFLLNPAFNIKRVPSAHKEVNVQANQEILKELVKNLEISRMNLLNETPFIETIDEPTYPITPKKLGKTKSIILGGILGGLVIIGFLVFTQYIKKLL
jgi:uncharacterized protein involved in exopolysaccharide biosynthesis